jgi:hypothetical protein
MTMNDDLGTVDSTGQPVGQQPVGQQTYVQEHVVHERVVEPAAVVARDDVFERRSIVATPSMLLTMIAGTALVILGIVVLLRGDMSNSWTEPLEVSGLAHAVLLGMIDVGVGVILLLLAFGSASGRVGGGVLLAIGGAVLWIANSDLRADLGAPWGFGAAAVVTGAAIALLAMTEGDRSRTSSRRIDHVVS